MLWARSAIWLLGEVELPRRQIEDLAHSLFLNKSDRQRFAVIQRMLARRLRLLGVHLQSTRRRGGAGFYHPFKQSDA